MRTLFFILLLAVTAVAYANQVSPLGPHVPEGPTSATGQYLSDSTEEPSDGRCQVGGTAGNGSQEGDTLLARSADDHNCYCCVGGGPHNCGCMTPRSCRSIGGRCSGGC